MQGAAGLHQQTVLPREGQLRVGAADPGKAGKAHTPGQLPGWQLGQFLRRGGGQVAVSQHAALAAAALPSPVQASSVTVSPLLMRIMGGQLLSFAAVSRQSHIQQQ